MTRPAGFTIKSASGVFISITPANATKLDVGSKVETGPSSQVLLTTPGAITDLKPGTPILVAGQPDSTGALTATAITMQQTTSPPPPIGSATS